MGTIDQRTAARYNVEVSAEVYTPQAVLPASTRNLSTTGVCFEIDRALEEGSTVGVSLFLTSDGIEDPDTEALNIKSEIIWCSERDDSGFTVGARFNDLSDENSATLKEFLGALEI